MKLRTTLIATAVAGLFAVPAFATGDDAVIFNLTDTTTVVDTIGFVSVGGHIDIGSQANATVDQDQITESNTAYVDGAFEASVSGNAMRGAEGNLHANVASGVGNAQSNDAALAAVDGDAVFAKAQTFSSQTTAGNFALGFFIDQFDATVDGNALAGARGNIGLNVAAGVGNAQSNAMAASATSSGNLAIATSDSEQLSVFNELYSGLFFDLTASLSGNALAGAQGNIGVNITSGVGNVQHNSLSIASATCGNCP